MLSPNIFLKNLLLLLIQGTGWCYFKVEIKTFRITNHVVENFKSLCTECRL